VQEFRSLLLDEPNQQSPERALGLYGSTFDHPMSEIYYEAYRDGLSAEERQQLSVLALQCPSDSVYMPWLVADVVDDPPPMAAARLQQLAKSPNPTSTSNQEAVCLYASAIAALERLGVSLLPYEQVNSSEEAAWRRAAPLIYALNRLRSGHDVLPQEIATLWDELERTGSSGALDVVIRISDRFVDERLKIFPIWSEYCASGVSRLCRRALSIEYSASSYLRSFGDLADEHRLFALRFLKKHGRQNDLSAVVVWLEHPRFGEIAHSVAQSIENGSGATGND
jgi:hypothetical protein